MRTLFVLVLVSATIWLVSMSAAGACLPPEWPC